MKKKIKYGLAILFSVLVIAIFCSIVSNKKNLIEKELLSNPNVLEVVSIESNQSNHERFRIKLVTKNNVKVILSDIDFKSNELIFGRIDRIGNYGIVRELYFSCYSDNDHYEYLNIAYPVDKNSDFFDKIYEKKSVSLLLENVEELKAHLSKYPIVDDDFYDLLKENPDEAAKIINPDFDKTKCSEKCTYTIGYYIHKADVFSDGDFASQILDDVAEQLNKLFEDMLTDRKSFEAMGIDFEEKAFYDILVSCAKKFDFESQYPEEKMIDLAKKIKLLVAQNVKYTDWNQRIDVKAEMKADLRILLDDNGYPPVPRDEVFKEVFEQAENFKKYED